MRYINYYTLKALIYILKLIMDNVKVHIFFSVFSIKIKKRQGLSKFEPIINTLCTNMKCM